MTYDVPKPKPYKEREKLNSVADAPPMPSVYVPVSKAMLSALSVGKEATITLKGTIRSLESREGDTWDPKNEVKVEVTQVSIPDTGDIADMVEADEDE